MPCQSLPECVRINTITTHMCVQSHTNRKQTHIHTHARTVFLSVESPTSRRSICRAASPRFCTSRYCCRDMYIWVGGWVCVCGCGCWVILVCRVPGDMCTDKHTPTYIYMSPPTPTYFYSQSFSRTRTCTQRERERGGGRDRQTVRPCRSQ
jgi:hypothetical protein